ncbi:hypothetical protein HMPREF2534_00325 [Bacteroides thetaiotaomicron]|nr:hypothetical protein HMPREF2534_00325 [Bacteroides thetaiotaomicron]
MELFNGYYKLTNSSFLLLSFIEGDNAYYATFQALIMSMTGINI